MFADRRRVVLNGVLQERTGFVRELSHTFHSGTNDGKHLEEPASPGPRQAVGPQPCRAQDGLDPYGEIVEGEAHDVLLVEPIELLRIENGVAPADAGKAECRG